MIEVQHDRIRLSTIDARVGRQVVEDPLTAVLALDLSSARSARNVDGPLAPIVFA